MNNFWIKFSVWLVQGGVTSMTLKLIAMFIKLLLFKVYLIFKLYYQ
jgi:hypothetical protein